MLHVYVYIKYDKRSAQNDFINGFHLKYRSNDGFFVVDRAIIYTKY